MIAIFVAALALGLASVPAAAHLAGAAAGAAPSTVHFVCAEANDVFRLLSEAFFTQPFVLRRYDTLAEAIASPLVRPGDSLLVLIDGSQEGWSSVTQDQYAQIGALGLAGAYLEMPSALPGDAASYGPPTQAWYFDRVTAITDDLATCCGINRLDIMQAQGAFFQNYNVLQNINSSHLAYAHVAGSNRAVYGLPATPSLNPVLFDVSLPGASRTRALVGGIALSCVVRCRYTPRQRWQGVWNFILGAVLAQPYNLLPSWTPLVYPNSESPAAMFAGLPPHDPQRQAKVRSAALDAVARATDWMRTGSGLLVIGDNDTCPAPFAPMTGATVACMLEGFSSRMNADGSQQLSSNIRMDCSAETAMALAVRAVIEAADMATADGYALPAAALMDFVWLFSSAAQGHDDPADPSFGLLAWGVGSSGWSICTYGDDNARVLLASAITSAVIRKLPTVPDVRLSDWDAMNLKSMLGNLRIASVHGFRPGRINYPDVSPASGGWQRFHNSFMTYDNASSPQPHYQCQMWAVFFWAYAHTGYDRFYTLALAGVEQTVQHYLGRNQGLRFQWTEYLSEEQSRLILPLAWLLRCNLIKYKQQVGRKGQGNAGEGERFSL
jgi:hypothetical protein